MSKLGVGSVSIMVAAVTVFLLGVERTVAITRSVLEPLEPLRAGIQAGIADTNPWWILGASCVSLVVSVAALVVAWRVRR